MKSKILSFLKSNKDDFISGEKISQALGISRTAVWKYIKALKEEGYNIESISRKGYRIISSPDLLTFEEIKEHLITNVIGQHIIHFDTIGSTNTKAKELADQGQKDGTVIISEEQTTGRGRLGRNWISPKYKGIWMSIILRPTIDPNHISKITQVCAAAVSLAMDEINIQNFIKWPNDIVVNSKKVCGILTEMSCELNRINHVVLGIGINVNIDDEDFPKEIKKIATSLKVESKNTISRKALVSKILNNFETLYKEFSIEGNAQKSLEICREKSLLLGKNIDISRNNQIINVKAIDINDDGELIVEHSDGIKEKLISGEVSLKGIYGI